MQGPLYTGFGEGRMSLVQYRQLITELRHNKKLSTVFVSVILGTYAFTLVGELDDPEPYPDFEYNVLFSSFQCDPTQVRIDGDALYRNFIKDWLNCVSFQVLHNWKVIPMLSSIACVYLVYQLGYSITKDRLIGILAMAVMTFNPLLTMWDTSQTYDQAWAAFFLLSVVLLYRLPLASPLVYPLAIASKIYAVGFLPAYLYNIYKGDIEKRKKVMVIAAMIVFLGIAAVAILGIGNKIGFYPERLLDGLVNIFENLWMVSPVAIALWQLDRFFKPKNRPHGKRIVIAYMGWIVLTIPLVFVFSQQYMFAYRFVPFAAFLSVYAGMIAVQCGNWVVEKKCTS